MLTTDRKQLISQTWKRFTGAIGMLVRSEQGPQAMVFAATLVVMMFGINGLNVLNSYVGRDFMSSIEARNLESFRSQAILYSLVFVASTVVSVLYRFTEERLGILWREQLTWKLADSYLSERTYYRLDSATGVANPDQRITEDVRAFTTTTLSFMLLILNGTLTAISFSGVLWSISPMLFGVAVLYALLGSFLTIWLGKPLIRLNYHQFDMEANFRADLIHVRENSESIALSHREGRFKRRLRMRLDGVVGNFRRLIRINRNLGFFTNGYNYFIQIIPALIIAPMFILGEVREFGVITQSTMAFATLLGAFSLIVTQFQSISAFTAVTARLHLLTAAIEKAHETKPCSLEVAEKADHVSYDHVTLHSGDGGRVLVADLTLEIQRGSHCLVTCPDDAPKVALFRATAGVWDCGGGKIARPGLEDILFLPERPYLPPGTLRDVLVRTDRENQTGDAEIEAVLRRLGLEEAVRRVGGLNSERDWDDEFSIGEQHMFSIARIFLAKPAFVFLDRPGSSLPKTQISVILEMLAELGVGAVVLAKNGESRLRYDQVLAIRPDGSWTTGGGNGADANGEHSDLRDLSC
jgi:vitamin B12/bleomycin/antimicrobial peptide transport system ATP-binding/permease protein